MDDVKAHSRRRHMEARTAPAGVAAAPLPDFSKWGAVEHKPMTGIRRKTAEHMQHAWMIPHVTNNDKADITELEQLRKQYRERRKSRWQADDDGDRAEDRRRSALKKFPAVPRRIDSRKKRSSTSSTYTLASLSTPSAACSFR